MEEENKTAEMDWAEHEVELACSSEKESADNSDDAAYGIACYESALRAYRCLMRDNHSGFSIQVTKSILNRLIDGKCLTPIEDTPDIWENISDNCPSDNTHQYYQCKRMNSLFKTVASDGTVTYRDVNRVQVFDVDKPDTAYTNGFTTRLIDKLFPITMPYLPASKKFKVVRDEFQSEDVCFTAYLYVVTPTGEKIELNVYFKEGKDGIVRIKKAEYEEQKSRREDKK